MATWLLLRTFRCYSENENQGIYVHARDLFRLACGAMFFYAMTQPPLGTKMLAWAQWTYHTNCETRFWKALMMLSGVPLSTIELKSLFDMDTSYLTMLATTALFALGLKTILKQDIRKDVIRDQDTLNADRSRHQFDRSANFIRPDKIHAYHEERTPRGRKRSTSTVETVSYVFVDKWASLHNNWIDRAIHQRDSGDVYKAALKSARSIASSKMYAESRGAKRLAQIILVSLIASLLCALGWIIYNWIPVIGSIYFFVLPVALLLCLSFYVVVRYEIYIEVETEFVSEWISFVVSGEPRSECRLDASQLTWLAEKLGLDSSERVDKLVEAHRQSGVEITIDDIFSWHDRVLLFLKLSELTFDVQEESSISNRLPGFLKSSVNRFDDLANSVAFALANFLVRPSSLFVA